MRRGEWKAFGRLRQALVHIQTTKKVPGRRPPQSTAHTQPVRLVRGTEASM